MNNTSDKKIRVGLFFGGKSAEHQVSLISARYVYDALDKAKFEPVLIGIDNRGRWLYHDKPSFASKDEGEGLKIDEDRPEVTLYPGGRGELIYKDSHESIESIDVAFPVLHGTYGEDGTIQGLFELANVPYVGPGVLGSSVAMDKDVAKRLLRDGDLLVSPFKVFQSEERDQINTGELLGELGNVLFVKPANLGSSVGVKRATNEGELRAAIDEAFKYDNKILIEQGLVGDEIECSVLGNQKPEASAIGRIIPRENDFYSYEAKYLGQEGVVLEVPAQIDSDVAEKAKVIAVKAYKTLCCEGMARVDMFATKSGKIYINEINTIPGFTKISMYPKLWQKSGLEYSDLITKLLHLAIDRSKSRQSLKTTQ